jgi:hypothetical protein
VSAPEIAEGATLFFRQPKSVVLHLLFKSIRRFSMADALRITVDELKRRMEAGEDFVLIDVRNPLAWAKSNSMLPEAIRVPLDKLEENLPRIPENRPVVAYCT